jgi:biopolymer transport protein TolR
MGASFNSQDKGSRNIELNIVPFIDLMSCLTAFLLVTAVWVNISSVSTEGAGRSRDGLGSNDEPPPPHLAILVESDRITVSSYPSGEARQVTGHDWVGLESALREFKTTVQMAPVEVAADSTASHPIAYSKLIAAMDTAVKAGYPRVGVVDARQLQR